MNATTTTMSQSSKINTFTSAEKKNNFPAKFTRDTIQTIYLTKLSGAPDQIFALLNYPVHEIVFLFECKI